MRKLKLLLITIFVIGISIIFGGQTYAANTMELNITNIRPYTNSEYTVITPNANVHTIFKIMKSNGTTYSYEDALYCLRSGLGFGDTELPEDDLATLADTTYTETYNLKTQATAVMNHYRTEVGYVNMSNDEYNSILWIIDNMYLPEHEDAAEMKEKLLEKAGIVGSVLTDDDIEFVQQMALWYYSNYDENGGENSLSLNKEYELMDKTEINGEALDETKASQIDILYNYFIENAILYATNYGTGDTRDILPTKTEFTVNSSTKTVTTDSGYTVIGPFSITKTDGEVGYELEIQVKDKNGKIIPEKIDTTPIIYVVKNPTDMTTDIASIEQAIGAGEFYLKISNRLAAEYDLTDVNIETKCAYEKLYKTTATLWLATNEDQPVIKVEKEEIKEFDLALRKYITKVNGNLIANSKEPVIDTTVLESDTTAEYAHRKDPVEVETGYNVTYKISVYNEGELPGIVTEIIDYLPEGLDFDIANNPEFIEHKDSYTEAELVGKKYAYIYDTVTRELRILPLEAEYLFELAPFEGTTLDTESIEVVCTVTATAGTADKVLTNIATMKYEPSNDPVADRDSSSEPSKLDLPTNPTDWENYSGDANNKPYLGDNTYYYKGQEDDDDFDKVIIKGAPFDLALRKFITKVNGVDITTRIPQIDTSKLNTVDETTGKKIETAKYTHSKEPVIVKQGDLVTFTIRVYNEGEIDGYAMEIADYIPEGLGYLLNYKENTDNGWSAVADGTNTTIDLVGTEGLYNSESVIKNLEVEDFYSTNSLSDVKILTGKAKIVSTALDDELIKAYNPAIVASDVEIADDWQQSTSGTDGLYYRDVEITCIVLAENTYKGTLRNIAEVEEDKAIDEDGNELNVADRDSTPENVDINNYTPPVDNSTYQEDDDDYELLELKYFDLALRKFITAVNNDTVTTRIPVPTINNEGNLEYVHDKTPVYVANSDLVTYTIRVYNEGTVLGYAMEVADDIPDGLVFLPEHELNKQYGWVMYDVNGEKTDDPLKAVEIRTKHLENSLLKPYDATKAISDTEPLNPDYADVKVVFQVIEEDITQEDRIIINKAQITEDKAVDEDGNELDLDDEDSIPDEWNEGEDDQDIEKIYVKKFDLALLKWVTQTIVTVDGKTTTTDTGFTPYDDPEPIAKVVIDKNKLNKTTVKFVYNIIIMNQGEIAGYATEITDYIPEGLEFHEEDNPIWEREGSDKITTRALEGTLLQPGESATIQVVFRWKQDSENLGLKTNIAEISEDYNDKGSKDIDSDPDNVETDNYDEQQEDDDDKALVILELKTGGGTSYIWLGLTVLLIIAGGIILIQKFVM